MGQPERKNTKDEQLQNELQAYRESITSSISRSAPDPMSTILPTSPKWSSIANPLFLQASFVRSIASEKRRHCAYSRTDCSPWASQHFLFHKRNEPSFDGSFLTDGSRLIVNVSATAWVSTTEKILGVSCGFWVYYTTSPSLCHLSCASKIFPSL